MGKSKTQTQTQQLDPQSQAYVQRMRQMATQGAQGMLGGGSMFTGEITPEQIQAAMNPYMENVIGGVNQQFDHLRAGARTGVDQHATMSGAFGGSRHGVEAGARLGELDRAQTGQIAGLMQQGYGQAQQFAEHQRQLRQQQMQEPMWRQQQAMQMMNLGMGPTGMTQTMQNPRDPFGSMAGGAMVGSQFGWPGAIAGGGIGLLGGLFG